ncbi:MAG: hypothetical protein OHK0023_18370 [Anaerolineae bacterium]
MEKRSLDRGWPRASTLPLWIAVITVLITALTLAIHYPHDSFWYDEALTTFVATDSWDTLWHWCTSVDIQVPFHYIVLKVWSAIAGDSEFMLRAISALAILLTVAGGFGVGKRLGGTSLGAVMGIAAGMLPGTLWIAYEVRAYAWALMLLTWATFFLLLALEKPRLWRLLLYAAIMCMALYTHYTALAGLAGHALLALIAAMPYWRRNWRAAMARLAPIGLAGLLFAPWLPVMLARGTTDRSFYDGTLAPEFALRVMFGFRVLGRQDDPLLALPYIGVYALLIGAGLIAGLMLPKLRRAAVIGLVLAAVPTAITVVLLLINPKLTGRYFWTAWTGLDLLFGITCVILASALTQREGRRAIAAIAISGSLIVIPYTSGERGSAPDSDFRGAFALICTEGTPEDVILLRDGTLFVAAEYYGNRPPCTTPRKTISMPDTLIPDVTHYLDLGTLQGKMARIAEHRPPNVWVVAWQGEIMDPQSLTYALLDQSADHVLVGRMFGDVRVDRYTNIDYEKLARLAKEGPLTQAEWFNLTPFPQGPTFVAARLFAPQVAYPGDKIVIHAWWERGSSLMPELRASARITTLDNGHLYTQVDQPPSGWNFWDDRWVENIPAFGRYELTISPDIPNGKVAVRYQLYDALGRYEPVSIVLGEVEVARVREHN